MCLEGFSAVKLLRRLLRPLPSRGAVSAVDRLEQRPLLTSDAGLRGADVVVLERSVHRQIMADMDNYRTSLLHLQQVLLQQVGRHVVCLSVCYSSSLLF